MSDHLGTWLTREEIRDMTREKLKVHQLEFLRLNGVKHYVDRRGWPVVSRAVAEAAGYSTAQAAPAPEWKPNKARAA
jgi:hypothetical protein